VPRHNRRDVAPPPASSGPRSFGEEAASWRGEAYVVRSVTGSARTYRCPGCDQEIRAGLPHVVAWPALDHDAEDRRHWHRACWSARERRAPGTQRSRSAPRY
jgi:hypothetical protein